MSRYHEDMETPYWASWIGRRVAVRHDTYSPRPWRQWFAFQVSVTPQFNKHLRQYVGLHPTLRFGPWSHGWFVPITPQDARPDCSLWTALRCLVAGVCTPAYGAEPTGGGE